jgi:hypothetical protein
MVFYDTFVYICIDFGDPIIKKGGITTVYIFFNLTIVKFMYIYRFTSDLGQVQQYGGLKPVNGIPTLPS